MTDILGAQPINEYGPLVTAISNPSATLIPIFMPDGTGAHASAQALLDKSNQTIVAYLTSGATAEWVSGAYAKATAVHYTDPAKLVSGTYVAGAAVTAGVVPPASPWLLSALDGKDGVSAVSTITATRPNVPAVGSDAIYSVGSAAGYGIGMYVDIINASSTSLGTFLIVGITTASLTLRNVTAIAGTTVSTGFTVVASGKPGTNGTNGTNGTSAIATASTFTQPAVNANVTVTVNSSAGFVDKQPLFHNLGGYYKVSGAPPSATTVTLQNLGYAGNIAAAASVGAGTLVPSGLKGADASGSGHTIQEEGVSLTQRSKLNFVGASATATDDAANDATVITLTSSGGATGIRYTLNTTAGTPTAGEIRSADLAVAGTIAISATDAATPGKSAADILARVKVGAIIEIAESLTKRIRATVTTDYTTASGSFAVSTPLVDGAIGNGAIVFLSIASDASGPGGPAGPPGSVSAAGAIDLTQVSTPAAPATSHTLIYAKSDGKLYRLNSAGGESELGAGGRTMLGADLTLYVRVDGSDNNNGLSDSAAGAFLTIQKAIDIAASLDLSIYSVTVKLGDGTYTVTQTIKLKAVTGVQSNIKIQGNPTTPSNVVINCTGDLFITSPYTDYLLKDFRINATGYGVRVTQARVRISGLVFDALGGSGLLVYSRGTIRSEGNCRIIGSAERFMWLYGNSIAEFDTGFTHSVENNPTFSVAFAQIAELSVFLGYGTVFSGLASGKKYILNSNSVTSGLGTENYFPGSTPGTKGTGVIYE
jgi:hypothetical protein